MTSSKLCPSLNRKGEPCGNLTLLDSDYCYVHKVKNENGKLTKKRAKAIPLNTVADILRLQSNILSVIGNKTELTSKELIAFSSLSQNYIDNVLASDKMKRLDQLEQKTKHLT